MPRRIDPWRHTPLSCGTLRSPARSISMKLAIDRAKFRMRCKSAPDSRRLSRQRENEAVQRPRNGCVDAAAVMNRRNPRQDRVYLALAALVPYATDIGLTLLGQSAIYWSGR